MTDEMRGIALGNARRGCAQCHGLGTYQGRTEAVLCGCALRSAFRGALGRYRYAQAVGLWLYRASRAEVCRRMGFNFGNKDAEFCADFVLIARRLLNDFEFQVFRLHFLCEMEWRDCLPLLARWVRMARAAGVDGFPHVDRGNFFHAVYRIENSLGRAYLEMKPYAVYPTGDYYRGHFVDREQIAKPTSMQLQVMGAGA